MASELRDQEAGNLVELPDEEPSAGLAPEPRAVETLPAWTYEDPEFFALEKERIFMRSWQVVCHVNEVREVGAYATLDLMGERALVIRGKDGPLRAFHNVCRHRAARVVGGDRGTCPRAMVCPYPG
jgi:phenylpropionate dioxygenase-like ring-hydroxylating dioxygenase large terminal subunit